MKKFLFLLLTATILSTAAMAKHEEGHCMGMSKGGFIDVDAPVMSIADIKKQPEDAYVTMQGHLVKRLSKDIYEFSDGTDNISVEIDNKMWRGQMISPKDMVMLNGEVEREDGMVMVEVKSIYKKK